MVAIIRTRLYREILTPALHRRFTRAAAITFVICYAAAVAIGEKSSWLWWIPGGRTGVRTLLLYISSLSVFVLRVAQLHLDARVTCSPFETFRKFLLRFNTVQTFSWYLLSAWCFSEIYFWSASEKANLGWIAVGKPWERMRLNERRIYLQSIFLMLALVQTLLHLCYDYDRVFLPAACRKAEADLNDRPHIAAAPIPQLRAAAPFIIQRVVLRSILIAISGPLIYPAFFRRMAWKWSLALARTVWDMPGTAELSYMPPYDISLIYRSLGSAFLLILLWETSNEIFGAFVAQEPQKNGSPLTDESRDANGTLLNGLKARKEVVKTFALWELVYISQRFEKRRQSILADIDRPAGPAWSQILSVCIGTIQGITDRIAEFRNPASKPSPQLQPLPRLSAPLKQGQVLSNPIPPTTRRGKITSNFGAVAKSYGESPSSGPLVSPRAKGYLDAARNKLLTPNQQQALNPSGIKNIFTEYVMRFLRSPLGSPFRQTFQRRVRSIVFGSPSSQFGQIVDAIDALSCLAIASLKEDMYGKVSKDVPLLIRTYANTITTLEAFMDGMPVHWTDIGFQDRTVEEVQVVLECLQRGLKEMVKGFGEYAGELGISEEELRTARSLAGIEEE